ncbi:MAG TPA: leucine--tRNA ligase [Candidatus Saccharimonadales bacterium]|nr:leucine--tRNA ligase [Candidatus Saccharimonadales bacterium]
MKRYNPKDIESHWQKIWADSKLYDAVDFDKRPKFVMLTEFPYPSGDGLHMGHIREYTYGDMLARYKRMQDYNVLYPMGYDEFGLPTENYAIKNKVTPQYATENNVSIFQKQLESLGYGIDWSRKVRTSDPDYYKWTQWLFLQFFKAGLAYQDEIAINWCPHCKTGLANEEVVNGRHERCDTLVEKKILKQWLLKITEYADRLLKGLKDVDYPDRIADQQINWIGRSEGMIFTSPVKDTDLKIQTFSAHFEAFRADTFVVIAPDHPFLPELVKGTPKEHKVLERAAQIVKKRDAQGYTDEENIEGIFTGRYIEDPVGNGDLPIWVSSYALAHYGTGIVKCSVHDERDFRFAKKYDIPLKPVLFPKDKDDADKVRRLEYCYTDMKNGILTEPEEFAGEVAGKNRQNIIEYLESNKLATPKVSYRLHDWIFSRQHYWGEPIPIIHCEEHGAVAVPDNQLPVKLPKVKNYEPTDTGESPLAAIEEWVNTTCPTCGKPARRETDTMPNWAGSSWYYLRYYDANNDKVFADRKKLDYWGAVDLYLGGMEHTTLHLLYSRFWHQFLYDQGLVPTPEPYKARRGQGIILAADGSKMSKSKGNVVNPSDIIDSGYGADALRLAIAFLAPYDQTTPWSPESVAGTHRFLQRVWTISQKFLAVKDEKASAPDQDVLRLTHRAIFKVSKDLDSLDFNTAIAALMETTNELYKINADRGCKGQEWNFAINSLLLLLAPFAPHMTEELWSQLGYKESIHVSEWPVYNEKYLVSDEINIVVQVNGKVRANISLPADVDEPTVIKTAQADDKVSKYLKKEVRKTIYVPKKLINFVV